MRKKSFAVPVAYNNYKSIFLYCEKSYKKHLTSLALNV